MDVTKPGNWSISYVQVTGSSVEGPLSAALYGGETGVGAEKMSDAEGYTGPGLVFRPRPPEEVDTADGPQRVAAEAFAARRGDELVPLAWRDLRFHKVYPAPKAGTVALVGYGGGFLSFEDAAGPGGRKLSNALWYVPYDFNGAGVPQKAHSIAIDPVQDSITIIHGSGLALTMDPSNGIVMRADGSTWLSLKPGVFEVVAAKSMLRGNVALGANPSTAVALAAGAASPPSLSVFVSSPT